MKTTLQSFAGLAAAIFLTNCTTYVEPVVSPTPTVTGTTTTTQSTGMPYDSVTTRKTTTTYQ